MVSRWKRLFYSAASMAIAAAVCDVAMCVRSEFVDAAHNNARFAMNSSTGLAYFASALVGVFGWVLLFCIPGWILALPIVLFVRNVSGLRFWTWWAAGTFTGPAVMYAFSIGASLLLFSGQGTTQSEIPMWTGWFSLATGVACLSTLLFLLLLRREQKRMESCEAALGCQT